MACVATRGDAHAIAQSEHLLRADHGVIDAACVVQAKRSLRDPADRVMGEASLNNADLGARARPNRG